VTYAINEPCIGTKDTSCVEVCSVLCIRPTPDEPEFDSAAQLYIDPDECIDCDAWVEACPVDAITAEDQVPDEWRHYIHINADYYRDKPWASTRRWTTSGSLPSVKMARASLGAFRAVRCGRLALPRRGRARGRCARYRVI
jgi:NAD-dependent dihydropyrimidine dehydrogenase PreA subunit